jgi:hypothetical protein
LWTLPDDALAALGACRVVADEADAFPCRVSLADAEVGETLLLLPHQHLDTHSPYRAGGPIFVREGVARAVLAPGVVPPYVARRLMSVRAYDAADRMVAAEVCDGAGVATVIEQMFADAGVAFIHLHNARRGCFSCRVERVVA